MINRHDKIAALYGDHRYVEGDTNQTVFLFALANENEQFLKYAFRDHPTNKALFNSDVFIQANVIKEIMSHLESCLCTELIMNVLCHADFSCWHHNDLEDFIDFISKIIDPDE